MFPTVRRSGGSAATDSSTTSGIEGSPSLAGVQPLEVGLSCRWWPFPAQGSLPVCEVREGSSVRDGAFPCRCKVYVHHPHPTPRRFRENLKPGINLPVCGRAAGRLCRLNPSPPNPSAPVRFRLAKQNALAVDRALVPPTAHKAHLRALHLALHNHARARQTSTQERSNRNRIGDCDPGGGPSRGLILRACRAEAPNSGWIFEMCRMTSGGAPLQLPALSQERRIFCGGEPG